MNFSRVLLLLVYYVEMIFFVQACWSNDWLSIIGDGILLFFMYRTLRKNDNEDPGQDDGGDEPPSNSPTGDAVDWWLKNQQRRHNGNHHSFSESRHATSALIP